MLVSNTEELAVKIHYDYKGQQLLRNLDKAFEYQTWKNILDTLKFFSILQAQHIVEKIFWVDCYVGEKCNIKQYKLSFYLFHRMTRLRK